MASARWSTGHAEPGGQRGVEAAAAHVGVAVHLPGRGDRGVEDSGQRRVGVLVRRQLVRRQPLPRRGRLARARRSGWPARSGGAAGCSCAAGYPRAGSRAACGRMPAMADVQGDEGPFDSLHLTHSSTVDRVADELRRAVFDGELESGHPAAGGRARRLARGLPVDPARSPRGAGRRGRGRPSSPTAASRSPRPTRMRSPTCAGPAPSSRWPVSGTGRAPRRRPGSRCAPRWRSTPPPSRPGASYQRLNERHLALHLSLVGLTESPRLVSMAESLVSELKVALAQIDRVRRNAHLQAGLAHPAPRPPGPRRDRRRGRRPRGAPRRCGGRHPGGPRRVRPPRLRA